MASPVRVCVCCLEHDVPVVIFDCCDTEVPLSVYFSGVYNPRYISYIVNVGPFLFLNEHDGLYTVHVGNRCL